MTGHKTLMLSLLLLLAMILASGCGGVGEPVESISDSTPTKTPRPTFTPDAGGVQIASELTFTVTPPPSPTLAIPTATPSRPPVQTPTAPPPPTLEPTATFTPEPTATPVLITPTPPAVFEEPDEPGGDKYDFRIIQQGIIPEDENGGKGPGGKHLVLLHAVDQNGQPLDGVVFQDIRSGIEAVSGDKESGHTLIDMWANTLVVKAVRDANTGRTYTSEETHRLSLSEPELEDLVAPGYCESVETCEYNPYMWHFSYRIVFQRQW